MHATELDGSKRVEVRSYRNGDRKRASRRGRKRDSKLYSSLSRKSVRVFNAHRREGGLGLRKCGHPRICEGAHNARRGQPPRTNC